VRAHVDDEIEVVARSALVYVLGLACGGPVSVRWRIQRMRQRTE